MHPGHPGIPHGSKRTDAGKEEPMHPLIEKLMSEKPVVTDGSWGTQFQKRGLKKGECPDSWNLTRPDLVGEVAGLYVGAGSRIILTNTFGSNRIVLKKFGMEDRAAAICEAGVRISKEAAGTRAYVFASMGPTGEVLLMKRITEGEMRAAFEEQAAALARGGADGIVVETMMDPVEAKIALAAAKQTGLPVVASMVFDSGKDKDRTMTGMTPEKAAEELAQAGADAVGSNCGRGIESFIGVCTRMRGATSLPIWIKPNAGMPELVGGEIVYRTTAKDFGMHVKELAEAGAGFIGGCCGTNEEYIAEIRRALGKA
jgi:5-methyltetrahydrofolate--homocysteine methyltransferase